MKQEAEQHANWSAMFSHSKVASKFLPEADWLERAAFEDCQSVTFLSLTALPHTLLSWTDWRPHNSHYSMHFQTASLKLPLNVNHCHSQPKAVCLWLLAASVIDFQLMSLFFVVDWGQEHQGQQKSCLRVSITTSARAVMFLWAVCGKIWFVISR